jgi:GT2 family glycosyltransferase
MAGPDMPPRVSLVAPIYRHELYLAECLASFARQDWPELELVLIDDCSPDDSFRLAEAICAEPAFRARFSRIHVERNTANRGAPATLNAAIAASTGAVVMIVNTDDVYAPGRVAACMAAVEAGHELVFTGVACIGPDGAQLHSAEALRFEGAVEEAAGFPLLSLAFLGGNAAISTGNFCITRALLNRVGGFRDLAYCHDWDLALRCCLVTEPFLVAEAHYLYRLHGTNSFRALEGVAERESRFLLRDFFDALLAGNATNAPLAAIAATPGMLDALLLAGVPREEWRDARAGRAPRRLQPPALAVPTPLQPAGRRDLLNRRLGGAPCLVAASGEVHEDGWIEEACSLSFLSTVARGVLELRIFLPQGHRHRDLVVARRQDGVEGRQAIRLAGGEMATVAIPSQGAWTVLHLAITVRGGEQMGGDERILGANLLSVAWRESAA